MLTFPYLKQNSNILFCYSAEAFAVCENYSPPEGFNEKDLYHLLEKVGSPSGDGDLGNSFQNHFTTFLSLYQLLSIKYTSR